MKKNLDIQNEYAYSSSSFSNEQTYPLEKCFSHIIKLGL